MKSGIFQLIRIVYRFFFHLLYHELAFLYDFVAKTVSLGMWEEWIASILPFLDKYPILELGFGTGFLQKNVLENIRSDEKVDLFGIDESSQMIQQTRRKLHRSSDEYRPKLVRGLTQSLPFPSETFFRIASTFPSEYVFHLDTLSEINRVLKPGGKFVIIPTAWITGKSIPHRLVAGLFKLTHESPIDISTESTLFQAVVDQLSHQRLLVSSQIVSCQNSKLLVIIAEKPFH